MSSNRLRRIAKEIEETASDTFSKVNLRPAGNADDLTHLEGQFEGPPDTPYAGGKYTIDIRIPNDYPFRPPTMKFMTRIWHPNVSSQTGAICLDTLSTNWSPVFTIKSAIISVQGLLASPEPKDPQDAEVASMLLKNPEDFEHVARQWAIKYAGAPENNSPRVTINLSSDQASHSSQALTHTESSDKDKYKGYNPDLIGRFTAMGFGLESVVSAFESVGIDKNDGEDYELDEEYVSDITEKLFEES